MRRCRVAILRSAAWLVPREQRAEWYAEWIAELWYVHPARATAFCLGAFKDALWLRRDCPLSFRLESPLQCLSFLAFLAAAGLLICLPLPLSQDNPDVDDLVMISPAGHRGAAIRLAEYQSWNNDRQQLFTELAFYQPTPQRIPVGPKRNVELSIARASDNLFQLLKIRVPVSPPGSLILSRGAWRKFFAADPRIVGRSIDIAGHPVTVAGVIPEGSWTLPGLMDAWLLQNPQSMADLSPDSAGFVLARVRKLSTQRMFVPNDSGGQDNFDCVPLTRRHLSLLAGFLMIVAMSALILPVTTSLSLGEYPSKSGHRRWVFLGVKFTLILAIVYCAVRFVAYKGGADPGILLGSLLAFRWAIVDQRQRCPFCLRLLSNPVRFGQPSQTFLEWYGTEFICARGHGLLHVPEIPTSCYSTQRWLWLDRLN